MPDLKWRILMLVLTLAGPAIAQDKGTLESSAAAAARQSGRSDDAGQGTVWPGARPGAARVRTDRLLFQGLSRRRRGTAGQWPELAGHAACRATATGAIRRLIAFLKRFAPDRRRGFGMAGHSRRRHVAAARRPDADGPRLAPDRARRRHLADPHARRANSAAPSARRCRRPTWCARTGSTSIPGLWTPSHLAVVRAAAQDPAVQRIFVNAAIKRAMCRVAAGEPWMRKVRPYVRAQLSLPRPALLPARRGKLQGSGPDADRRRLRRFARLVVQRRGAAPEDRRTRPGRR